MSLIIDGAFVKPSRIDVENKIRSLFLEQFGGDADLDPESFLGMLASVLANKKYNDIEDLESIWSQTNPVTARGSALDSQLFPFRRKLATGSSGQATQEDSTETAAVVGDYFESPEAYGSGEYIVTSIEPIIIRSESIGAGTNIPSGVELTGIRTAEGKNIKTTSGIVGGSDNESDILFFDRFRSFSQEVGDSIVSKLEESLVSIDGIDYARVHTNNTNIEVDSVPAYGYEVVVKSNNAEGVNMSAASIVSRYIQAWTPERITEHRFDIPRIVSGNTDAYYLTIAKGAFLTVEYNLKVGEEYVESYDDIIKNRVVEYLGGGSIVGLVGVGGSISTAFLIGLIYELNGERKVQHVSKIERVTVVRFDQGGQIQDTAGSNIEQTDMIIPKEQYSEIGLDRITISKT